MFHVSFAEFLEGYLCRSSVDAPNDLRLSKCKKCFGVPLIRTLRRLLYSFPVLIVVVDPPNSTSSVDSHLRLLFYPLPAARVFYARRGRIVENLRSRSCLKTIHLNKLLEFSQLKAQCATYFHKRNPPL